MHHYVLPQFFMLKTTDVCNCSKTLCCMPIPKNGYTRADDCKSFHELFSETAIGCYMKLF